MTGSVDTAIACRRVDRFDHVHMHARHTRSHRNHTVSVFLSLSVKSVQSSRPLRSKIFVRTSPEIVFASCFGTAPKVWGLSAHPTERLYATCGDDGSVRIWSLDDRRVMGSISTDCSCRALCYSPDGNSLAVRRTPRGNFVVGFVKNVTGELVRGRQWMRMVVGERAKHQFREATEYMIVDRLHVISADVCQEARADRTFSSAPLDQLGTAGALSSLASTR